MQNIKIVKKPEKRRIFRTNDATFKNDATCLVFNVDIGFFFKFKIWCIVTVRYGLFSYVTYEIFSFISVLQLVSRCEKQAEQSKARSGKRTMAWDNWVSLIQL